MVKVSLTFFHSPTYLLLLFFSLRIRPSATGSSFTHKNPALRPLMFNDSKNIVIQGGTFLVVNGSCNMYPSDSTSHFLEKMDVNAYQTPELEEDERGRLNPHVSKSQVPDTHRFSHRNPSWQANIQQFSEPESYSSLGYPSAMSFGISVHACRQIPEHSPYPVVWYRHMKQTLPSLLKIY
ncbi:hypothetical protein BYT27DRAFT_6752972 [Phlegmacium glaucopus]|nr:hypothetical protein BYT27DRAFT_6752972 [Phlegmacium glaucopus]